MRLLLQKVTQASVFVNGKKVGGISKGYLLFLGVLKGDNKEQVDKLSAKIINLRLFESDEKINDKSILDINGEILVVSQFTLACNLKKGNRPDYTKSAPYDFAKWLYEYFISKLKALGVSHVESGEFGANMKVQLINDGPVTLIIDR